MKLILMFIGFLLLTGCEMKQAGVSKPIDSSSKRVYGEAFGGFTSG